MCCLPYIRRSAGPALRWIKARWHRALHVSPDGEATQVPWSAASLVLVGGQPARLVILARLIVVALRRRHIAAVVVILLSLPVGIGVVNAPAAWRRIARLVGRAVGRIDIAVIGACLWRSLLRLRREHNGIAGGVVLLVI